MPAPRKPRQPRTSPPRPAAPSDSAPAKAAPTRSRPRLFRFAGRCLVASAYIGCLTAVAGWHADGLVRSGQIERMLRMGPGAPPAAEAKSRGKLDRGRLNALAATAAR